MNTTQNTRYLVHVDLINNKRITKNNYTMLSKSSKGQVFFNTQLAGWWYNGWLICQFHGTFVRNKNVFLDSQWKGFFFNVGRVQWREERGQRDSSFQDRVSTFQFRSLVRSKPPTVVLKACSTYIKVDWLCRILEAAILASNHRLLQ